MGAAGFCNGAEEGAGISGRGFDVADAEIEGVDKVITGIAGGGGAKAMGGFDEGVGEIADELAEG